MSPPALHVISTSTVQPSPTPHYNAPERCNLTPFDLSLLTNPYIQKGLLFHKPQQSDGQDQALVPSIIARLKHSLSHALSHFAPLAGRLTTEPDPSSSSSIYISIDCNGAGAQFIYAVAADTTVIDVISPPHVPPIVRSFFPLNEALGHDGHSLPLLVVQLTELLDGFFVACSFNHVVGDGTAFWHFFNSWAEIARKTGNEDVECAIQITRPPVLRLVCIRDVDASPIPLPISKPKQFMHRFTPPPPLRERYFHFTAQSIKKLKAKANDEEHDKTDGHEISSFQALIAHVWRSITRARRLPDDSVATHCVFAIDNRRRLVPPLSRDYFGNCLMPKHVTAAGGELLANGLGWAASLLHDSVVSHGDANVRLAYHAWLGAPLFYSSGELDGRRSITVGGSPRFDVYGVDFGWGKAVAVRSGQGNNSDGRVVAFPGREGGGSVDLEIFLTPEVMCALESDIEFMKAVESPRA